MCVICTYLRHVTVGRSHDITCLLHAQRMGQAYLPEKDRTARQAAAKPKAVPKAKAPPKPKPAPKKPKEKAAPEEQATECNADEVCALLLPLPSILSAHSFTDKACWTAVQFMRHRALPMTSMLSGPEASCAAGTCCCYGPEKEHMLRL